MTSAVLRTYLLDVVSGTTTYIGDGSVRQGGISEHGERVVLIVPADDGQGVRIHDRRERATEFVPAPGVGHPVISGDGRTLGYTLIGGDATFTARIATLRPLSPEPTVDPPPSGASAFHPVAPQRVLDSRPGGRTVDGEAAVTGAAGSGYVTARPCDTPTPPNASSLNFAPGADVANLIVVPLSAAGDVCLFVAESATHLVADVAGALAASGTFVATSPRRLLDTRPGGSTVDQRFAGTAVQPGGRRLELEVRGRTGVPADAVAVALNVTVTGAAGDGYLTAWPCDPPTPPNASHVNFAGGRDVLNAVVVPISAVGTVCLQSSVATHVIADLNGWFVANPQVAHG